MSRTRRSRLTIGVGVTSVVAAMVVPAPVSAAEAGSAPVRGHGSTVTLVTGDVVTVVGKRARVRPAEGREGLRFLQRTDAEGDVHVIPSDVLRDVASGRVDGRLFDVSGLIKAGYDDRRSRVTPLIIVHDGPNVAGASGQRALPSIGAVALKADKSVPFLAAARTAGVERIWLDGPVRATLDRSVPQIGAPAAWAAGHTGAGTTVAVLDTGVDATHPDLAGAVVGAQDFSESGNTDDFLGHGTHVAATVTGGGKYQGVAPDAKLLNGKVLDDHGFGTESGIIAGMEWAAAEGADVVNLSLGSSMPSDGTDPMSQAVNRLTAETGALFVVAAGNSGPTSGSIGSPAAADAALTVGAVDRTDALADFSSRGPRKDGGVKPDITAPGVDIVAAKAANGVIGAPVGDKHVALSGTSMASPHVAGAAAILAGQHPDWSPEQIKAALMASAAANPDLSVYEQGAGRVDVAAAIGQRLTTSPPSVAFGTARWPHDDDQPINRTVTYRNSGDAPVTLQVSADLRDADGNPAPAGLLTVTPAQVTVPAGGEAEVALTAVTNLDAPDGHYSGAITATGGGTEVRTPIGLNKEVESYDVTLTHLGADGNPAADYVSMLVGLDEPGDYSGYDPSGTVALRVPKGRYALFAFLITAATGDSPQLLTLVGEPEVVIDRDAALVVDARNGREAEIAVDRPDARVGFGQAYIDVETGSGGMGFGVFGPGFDGITFVPTARKTPGKATFGLEARLARPSGEYEYVGSPYQYNVGWTVDGGIPESLAKRFTDRSLVKVKSSAVGTGNGFFDLMAGGKLPYSVTEYYSPDMPWYSYFDEMSGPNVQLPYTTQSLARPEPLTRATTRRWNAAVFGPALPTGGWPDQWAGRMGDELFASIPMFTDQYDDHAGSSQVDTAWTTLHRGDRLIAESEYDGSVYGVDPGGSGAYRLRTEATRSVSPLSTKVSADWTFRSTSGDDPTPLPLIAVRFAPKLDDANRAKAGVPFTVPVYVQHNGSTAESVRTPSVQVSYDDGRTWKRTYLIKLGSQWHALLVHPKKATFVSFKAQAHDGQGNSVDQTIIRAYALK
ncbi:S8 family serine peptidase [Actinokineospora guangxiensis]|uniref:S8 family serine peptidase n=1 Tax=Actinokineospora guangxiensis TaxID=1490288 RepID=A0ABW0ERD9_9PSEU